MAIVVTNSSSAPEADQISDGSYCATGHTLPYTHRETTQDPPSLRNSSTTGQELAEAGGSNQL